MNVNLKADTTGKYGDYGILPALYDVEATFILNASGSRSNRSRFRFDPNPFGLSINGKRPDQFAPKDHIQSVARLSGEGQENILVFTRSAKDKGDAGLYIVPFNEIESDGDAWESEKGLLQRDSRTANEFLYYRFDGVNHAGGIQALGSMVFVANDCDRKKKCDAHIQILDLRNPFGLNINKHDRYISKLEINGDNGEPTNSNGELINDAGEVISSRASAVAATRLHNGKYLMFVGGRGSGEYGWFYVSDSPQIHKKTKWEFIDFWDRSDIADGEPWHAWETINFISDAKNGDIYMVAMGVKRKKLAKDNKSFLYRLTQTGINSYGNPNLNFEFIDGRGLNTSRRHVTTRYGAGIHITPNRNIVSYVTDKKPPVKINQFRYNNTIINGTDADDSIFGKEENDTIYGGYGNDFLGGWSGDDLIFGGRDNDSLYGDSGMDTLHGEDGNDLIFGHTDNQEVINTLGEDNNTDYLYGGSGNDTIYGNNGNDQLFGEEDFRVIGVPNPNFGNDLILGGNGDDYIDGGRGEDTLDGGENNDTINGRAENDLIYGEGGSDTIFGEDGNDQLFGEEDFRVTGVPNPNFGNDLILGGNGDDYIDGGRGEDTLDGGDGSDTVSYRREASATNVNLRIGIATVLSGDTDTLTNIENVVGSAGDDQIIGNQSSNTIFGEEGKDSLEGEQGDDKLIGGKDADILDGGEDNDTTSYSTATEGVTANLTNSQENTGDAQGDLFQSIENLEGSEFGDRLFADVQNNDIQGLGGDDYLDGLTGDDTMSGGTGNDTYKVESVNDVVIENIDQGIDTVDAAIDYILGANLENLNLLEGSASLNGIGNELNNIINGNSGDNVISGGDGDDSIIGGLGNESSVSGSLGKINGTPGSDILTGGNGNDAFIYNNIADTGDLITDFTVGDDKIVVTELLQSLGYAGSNPITDRFLGFKQASDSLAVLQIDPDGAASNLFNPMPFILLDNVSVAALNDSSNFVF